MPGVMLPPAGGAQIAPPPWGESPQAYPSQVVVVGRIAPPPGANRNTCSVRREEATPLGSPRLSGRGIGPRMPVVVAFERGEQVRDLLFDQVTDAPKLLGGHVAWIGDFPVHPLPGEHERALVATPHRHGHVHLLTVELVEPLGGMRGEVVAEFSHGLDCLGIDPPRGPGAGAGCCDSPLAMHAGKRLRHLAAVGVFDAHKQHTLHGELTFITVPRSWAFFGKASLDRASLRFRHRLSGRSSGLRRESLAKGDETSKYFGFLFECNERLQLGLHIWPVEKTFLSDHDAFEIDPILWS